MTHSVGKDKYVMLCIHHFNTVDNILTSLKFLCMSPFIFTSPLIPGSHDHFTIFTGFCHENFHKISVCI